MRHTRLDNDGAAAVSMSCFQPLRSQRQSTRFKAMLANLCRPTAKAIPFNVHPREHKPRVQPSRSTANSSTKAPPLTILFQLLPHTVGKTVSEISCFPKHTKSEILVHSDANLKLSAFFVCKKVLELNVGRIEVTGTHPEPCLGCYGSAMGKGGKPDLEV